MLAPADQSEAHYRRIDKFNCAIMSAVFAADSTIVLRSILAPILRSIHRLVTGGTLVLIDPGMSPESKNTVLRSATHYSRFFGNSLIVSSTETSSTQLTWKALRSRSVLVTGKY